MNIILGSTNYFGVEIITRVNMHKNNTKHYREANNMKQYSEASKLRGKKLNQ